jgi:signal transduction histidine kinase
MLDHTMEQQSAALRAMNDAVLAIAAEATIEPMLQRLAHAARELVDARYAAIGVPDGEGAFAQFITSGMSDELIAAMGPLPRTHGLLGAMLTSPVPYRTVDVRRDPRFRGWWPSAHPQMRSFLGVPIVAASGIVGALYLTDKVGADEFDDADQQLIEMLAVHAALAIEKTRLYERSRELSIVEERNRLARELHDSVTQKLFGVTLTAEAAATVIDRDTTEAKTQIRRLQQLAREAMEELRSLIFELRPPAVETEGLATALRKHIDVLQRVHGHTVTLRLDEDSPPRGDGDADVLRIAQEALQNALRHARADHVDVRLHAENGHLRLAVTDDGVGFDPADPALRARRLGLTSMEERARALGARLTIDSQPGSGTTVSLEVPR